MGSSGVRVAAPAALLAIGGVLVTAWAAGWLRTPRVVLADFESRTSAATGVIGSASRLVVRDAAWRPVRVEATLRAADGASRVRRSAVSVGDGVERQPISVAGPVAVAIELPRLRGLQSNDTITLSRRAGDPAIAIENVRARYPWNAWMVFTLLYAAIVGAWFSRSWQRPTATVAHDTVGRTLVPGRFSRSLARSAQPWRLAVALAVCAVTILAVRKADALLAPQFWAEDAVVFFREARLLGLRALVQPYAGYWHLFPRAVAAVVAQGPAPWAPMAFALAALLPVFLVARLLASPRLALGTAERAGCMVLTVLPPMPGEVLLNLTNAQWVLGFVFVVLLLMEPPRHTRSVIADVFVVGLAGLTGPFVLVFAPLFIARAILRPSPGARWTAAAASVAALVQGAVLLVSGRMGLVERVPIDVAFARLGTRIAPMIGMAASEDVGFLVAATTGAVLVLVFAAVAIQRAWAPAVAIGSAILLFVAVIVGAPAALAAGGERYFSLPVALALWGGLLARGVLPRTAPAALALVLLVAAPGLFVPPLPDLDWADRSPCLDAPGGCVVPINPAGWSLNLQK